MRRGEDEAREERLAFVIRGGKFVVERLQVNS